MGPLVIAGVTMSLVLASAVALNNTLEDTGEITDYYPPSLKAPYPEITFTTPPDIPLAREYAPYERQYGVPAEEYGTPAREYGTPAREYGTPAREYGTPAREYGTPAREYGPPAREYGAPFRSSYHRYPPSPAREIPPVAEYAPPTGFGMPPPGAYPPPASFPPTGGFPPPGAFPPTGGFPPPGAALLPPGGYPPHEVSSEELKSRLYVLFEPAAVLAVGVTIFVVIRHYFLPYLIYWARSLEEDELELEDERSLDDLTILNILKAVTRGVCLSRISCQLGMMARNYTIKDLAISAIEEEKNPPRLAVIFRDSATGRVQSCEPYICRRKRLPLPRHPPLRPNTAGANSTDILIK